MKAAKTKMPRSHLNLLRDAMSAATFDSAAFFSFDPDGDKKDAELRERTRLYRETWIIPQIKAVIDWAENKESTY